MDITYWFYQLENNFLSIYKIVLIVIIFIIITLYVILKGNKELIMNNWVEYRCNPFIMPFAGYFGKSSGDNFKNCLWVVVKKYADFLLKPIRHMTHLISKILNDFRNNINSIRSMTKKVRVFFLSIVQNVMDRIWNMISYVQYFIVKLQFTMKRAHGIMSTIIYSSYTSIETLQSIWRGPIGGFARFFCFHPNTPILLSNNNIKYINQLTTNDTILSGGKVIGIMKFKLLDTMELYNYRNTWVTKEHLVYLEDIDKWIRIDNIKDKLPILDKHLKPKYLSSIITENNVLVSNKTIFSDYVETNNLELQHQIKDIIIDSLNNKSISRIKNNLYSHLSFNRSNKPYLIGFANNTPIELSNNTIIPISNIEIDMETKYNGRILGIIKQSIDYEHLYQINNIVVSGNHLLYYDNRWNTINNILPINDRYKMEPKNDLFLYCLVTTSGYITINNLLFTDYLEISNIEINNYLDNLVLMELNNTNKVTSIARL